MRPQLKAEDAVVVTLPEAEREDAGSQLSKDIVSYSKQRAQGGAQSATR